MIICTKNLGKFRTNYVVRNNVKKTVKRRRVRVLSSSLQLATSAAACSGTPDAVAATDNNIDGTQGEKPALELDNEIFGILGINPTANNNYVKEIQNKLAVRLEHSATEGLSKDTRKNLVDTYLPPRNCKLLGTPVLNPELKAALTKPVVKRDKAIKAKQIVLSAAISRLGQAISLAIFSKEKDTTLLKLLMDTGHMSLITLR